MTEFPIERRDLLRATGASAVGASLATQATTAQTAAEGPTVYVGSRDETLYAVDAATGSQEWAFTQPSSLVRSSPTVVDGTVYVGSWDDTLYAVDAATGNQEWAFTQPSVGVWSSPTVADGTVYVGSYDDTLYAVDAATGSQEWAFTQPSSSVWSSPTFVADPEDGDSTGSRVNLGTLGHHHVWANRQSDTVTIDDLVDGTLELPPIEKVTISGSSTLPTDAAFDVTMTAVPGEQPQFTKSVEDVTAEETPPGEPNRWSITVDFSETDDGTPIPHDTAFAVDITHDGESVTPDGVPIPGLVVHQVTVDGLNDGTLEVPRADPVAVSGTTSLPTEATFDLQLVTDPGQSVPFFKSFEVIPEPQPGESHNTWTVAVDFTETQDGVDIQEGTTFETTASYDGETVTPGGQPVPGVVAPPDAGGSVTGHVVADDDEKPIQGVDLYLLPPSQESDAGEVIEAFPDVPDDPGEELDPEATAVSTAHGGYTMDDVSPGQYLLLVVPPTDTAFAPRLRDGVVVQPVMEHIEDISLPDERPLAPLDEEMNEIIAHSEYRLDRSTETAAEVFVDGVEMVADELIANPISVFSVIETAFDVDLEEPPEEVEEEIEEEIAIQEIDVAEAGIERILEAIWNQVDAHVYNLVDTVTGELLGAEWFTELDIENGTDIAETGYKELPPYSQSVADIEAAANDYELIAVQEPVDGFSVLRARDELAEVRKQLKNERYGTTGVVVLPDGDVSYSFDRAETSQRSYQWTKDRIDDVGSGQTVAAVGAAVGIGLIATGKGAPLGAKVLSKSAKTYKGLELADSIAKVKLAADWGITQLHWGVDASEISDGVDKTVNWLDTAIEEPLADGEEIIVDVDMNLTEDAPFPLPYVVANWPEETPAELPAFPQTVAVEEITIDIENTGDDPIEVRATFHDEYNGGDNVSNQAMTFPAAENAPVQIPPGDIVTLEGEYAADFDVTSEFGIHTAVINFWVDGTREHEEEITFAVLPSITLDGTTGEHGADSAVRTPGFAATTAHKSHDEPLALTDIGEVMPDVETVLDADISPDSPMVQTQYTTSGEAHSVEFILSGGGTHVLQVLDDDGNLTGYDPDIDVVRTELSGSTATDPLTTPGRVQVPTAPGTTYTVRVIGYRFRSDRSRPIEVQAVETPDRDAILSVSPDRTQAFLTSGRTERVELGVSEAGGQVPLEAVDLVAGTFTDDAGNELENVAIEPAESGFDVDPGGNVSVDVLFDAGKDVPLTGEGTRFDGVVTVQTANAGSLDVNVSALLLATEIEGARLLGAGSDIDGIELTEGELGEVDPPEHVGTVGVYELERSGDGSVQIALPRQTDERGVFAYTPTDWSRLNTGRTDEGVRVSVPADISTVVIGVEELGPPALPGFENPPQDIDGDGRYEDIDGDGAFDIFDVQALFNHLDSDAVQNNPEAFNFSEDDSDEVTILDVQALFEKLVGWDE